MKKKTIKCLGLIVLIFFLNVNILPVFADELSNKEFQWNFKPAKDQQPASTEPHYEDLLKKYRGFYLGDTSEKELYITFDNGYENGYTEKVLDVLQEKEVPAAFFVTGHFITQETELIQRMVDEGHIVGNHSYHHPSFPEISDERLVRELESLDQAYKDITGRDDMIYLRPPKGTFSERSLAKTAEMGYTNVFWSLAYKDWLIDSQSGADYAYDKIMSRIHPGAILLLHSVSSDNAEALPRVIDDLKDDGYTFKSLDELKFKQEILINN